MEIAGAVIDDSDMHDLWLREEPDHPFCFAARLRRWQIGVARPNRNGDRLPTLLPLRQPGLEEGKLGGLADWADGGANLLVSTPFQRRAAKIVSLEGEQHDERQTGPAEQDLPLVAGTEHPRKQGKEGQEGDQLDPHALIEQPKPRHEQRRPGEALLDERELIRLVLEVSRLAWRLIHCIERHGTSLTDKCMVVLKA